MTLTTTIQAAGFIVSDDNAIWGYGDTAKAAWESMLNEMRMGGVEVLTDAEGDARAQMDGGEDSHRWTRRSRFTVGPATARLIEVASTIGGDCAWGNVDGVACTYEEADAACA